MRKLLFALPLLALFGCDDRTPEQQATDNAAHLQSQARSLLTDSTIVCADGNQVRMVVYALGGNASSFTAWTILAEDGKPKRCVKRLKQTPAPQPEYEEVPQ